MSDDTRRIIDAIDNLSCKVGRVADNLEALSTLCSVVTTMLVLFIVIAFTAALFNSCSLPPTT